MAMQPSKTCPTTPKADALVRTVHPEFAAEKLGVTVKAILARRSELGLPSVEQQFPKHGLAGQRGK